MNKNYTTNKGLITLLSILLITSTSILIITKGTNPLFSDIAAIDSKISVADNFCPPFKPENIKPIDKEKNLDTTVELGVFIEDPNNDKMNVSFHNAINNNRIGKKNNIGSRSDVFFAWNNLSFETTYSWYVIVEDHEGTTQSDTWQFTTNYKPEKPTLISPLNNSIVDSISINLKINVSDNDDNKLNVTFYDASDNSVIKKLENVYNNVSVNWNDLEYDKTYQWYVKISDNITNIISDIWTFTTEEPRIEGGFLPPSGGGGGSSGGSTNTNNPPNAVFDFKDEANVTEEITFNASQSTDSDGGIVYYHWNFGDGSNITVEDNTITHKYQKVGIYDITLKVEDNKGKSSSNTKTIQINPVLKISDVNIKPPNQNINSMVNISFGVTNTTEIDELLINISEPNNENNEISIKENKVINSSIYYFNNTYQTVGNYSFFVKLIDINNFIKHSDTFSFSIIDNSDNKNKSKLIPTLKINNYTINITVNITDYKNISKVILNLTTPKNISYNSTMTLLNNSQTYYLNKGFNESGFYSFFIIAIDTNKNINLSDKYNFTINNTQLKPINNITITSNNFKINESVNISALIQIKDVNSVILNITSPDNNSHNFLMQQKNNTSLYFYNKTYNLSGIYTFFIVVNDLSNKSYISEINNFTLTK